jgi:hypothetical protein
LAGKDQKKYWKFRSWEELDEECEWEKQPGEQKGVKGGVIYRIGTSTQVLGPDEIWLRLGFMPSYGFEEDLGLCVVEVVVGATGVHEIGAGEIMSQIATVILFLNTDIERCLF